MTDPIIRLRPSPGDGEGALIIPIDVVDIASAKIREDKAAAAVVLQTSTNDRVVLGMSAAMVDAMIDTLTKVRAELTGAEATFSPEPINTFAVWGQAVEGRDFVGLVFDRSLPSRRAFLMPPGSARDIGHEMIRVARIASSAKADK